MRRLLIVLSLAIPVFAAGLVAIAAAAWALLATGLVGLVSPLLVLALASWVPLSIVAADRLVPGRPAPAAWPTLACPCCGAVLGCIAKAASSWDA